MYVVVMTRTRPPRSTTCASSSISVRTPVQRTKLTRKSTSVALGSSLRICWPIAGCAWPLTSSSFAESAIIGLAGRIEVPSPSAGRRTPVSSDGGRRIDVLVGERRR